MWNHFYTFFLFFIRFTKTRILNIRFEIRDVQNRVEIMKIWKKNVIIFSYKSFLFYKLFLFSMYYSFLFYKHSNFKNEIRNSRCLKSNKKSENRKSENDYVFLNIFVMVFYIKHFTF